VKVSYWKKFSSGHRRRLQTCKKACNGLLKKNTRGMYFPVQMIRSFVYTGLEYILRLLANCAHNSAINNYNFKRSFDCTCND